MATGAEKSCFSVILGLALCRDCLPAHSHHHRSWRALLLALQNLDILFSFWSSELLLISLRNFLVWLSRPELTSVACNQRILADTELLIEYSFDSYLSMISLGLRCCEQVSLWLRRIGAILLWCHLHTPEICIRSTRALELGLGSCGS